MYRTRHLFVGDDAVGKLCTRTKTVRVFDKFATYGDAVLAWLRSRHGIFCKLVSGDDAVAQLLPPVEFPPEIIALMSPQLGDLEPEVVAWAREHLSADDFVRQYKGRVEGVGVLPPSPEAGTVVPIDATGTGDAPPVLGDREKAEAKLRGAGVGLAALLFQEDGGKFGIAIEANTKINGVGDSWVEAADEFLESLEYAKATEPADKKPEGEPVVDIGPLDLSAPPVNETPAAVAEKPAAKKAAKKAVKKAAQEKPPEPIGDLKKLEEENDAQEGGE